MLGLRVADLDEEDLSGAGQSIEKIRVRALHHAHMEAQEDELQPDPEPAGFHIRRQILGRGEQVIHARSIAPFPEGEDILIAHRCFHCGFVTKLGGLLS